MPPVRTVPPRLSVVRHRTPAGKLRLALVGVLDSSTVAQLRLELVNALLSGPLDIEVDLKAATGVDHTSASVLLAAHLLTAENGRSLRVVGCTAEHRRVLAAAEALRMVADAGT